MVWDGRQQTPRQNACYRTATLHHEHKLRLVAKVLSEDYDQEHVNPNCLNMSDLAL